VFGILGQQRQMKQEDKRLGQRWISDPAAGASRIGVQAVPPNLRLLWLGLSLAGVGFTNSVLAEEPRTVREPDVLQEAAEIVSVVDAFDGQDPFDFHLTLGIQQTWKSSDITRETHSTESQLSSGGYTASNLKVAEYTEVTSRLNTRADVGLYHDLALVIRLPVILSNDRKLEGQNNDLALQGAPGERLFTLPFDSPTRSGIEYLAVGLELNLLNQWRDLTKPTWKVGIEGRFNVSDPMHACTDTPAAGEVKCADPSDVNRNGTADGADINSIPLEGATFSGERSAGVSRGTTGFAFHTYMSKRVKYIEPYAGIEGLIEFQSSDSDYGKTDVQGALVNHPPLNGTLVMGMAVMPWEAREKYQRIEFDLRFAGTYRSEGRDYSELFDALGSSSAASLREPKFAQYQAGPDDATPSIVNESSSKIYMTGITDVQQHGIYNFRAGATWLAGKFVKFNAGAGVTLVQGHLITYDQPCNPDFKRGLGRAGPCRSEGSVNVGGFSATGIPNANYREVINLPGRRFRVDSSSEFDLWLNATVMF
jgi:hypothetical protein